MASSGTTRPSVPQNTPNLESMRRHGHGTGCTRVLWEYWHLPEYRPPGVTEADYPCTCGLERLLTLFHGEIQQLLERETHKSNAHNNMRGVSEC